MDTFIVLGIVPGTDLQITFGAWLKLLEIAAIIYCFIKLKDIHQTLTGQSWERVPLHATQLHRRGQ